MSVYYRKLKADRAITGLLPATFALCVLVFVIIFQGFATGIKVLGGIVLIYSAFQYLAFSRVRSHSYFISATYMLSFSLFLFFVPASDRGISHGEFGTVAKFFFATTIILLFYLLYLTLTRKIKWKGREVFELAAMPVKDATDGFTERPRPAGKINYSNHDLVAFADFIRKNQIALPFFEEERVVMVPVMMGKEFPLLYGFQYNYGERTWIAFSYKGEVSVHISKKDYLEYRDQLSFDQLCESMGELFKEFMELFLKGEGIRVIDRLDSLKVGILS